MTDAHSDLVQVLTNRGRAVPGSEVSAEMEQHSLLRSVILHLFPGILITLFYIAVAPFFIRLGFPPIFSVCLSIPVIMIPAELGFLLYQGKKANGRFSLNGIVAYRERVPLKTYLLYGFIILVWSTLVFAFLQKPIGSYLTQNLFAWTPAWFRSVNTFQGSKPALLATWAMIMVFGNILGPAVEELYFRGYLLPRLSRLKGWAVPVNSILFALYHFYSPWDTVTRAVGVLPIPWIARKKKNLYIGMFAHWTLNTLSSISLLAIALK